VVQGKKKRVTKSVREEWVCFQERGGGDFNYHTCSSTREKRGLPSGLKKRGGKEVMPVT